jgi:hypothetical protein
MGKTSVELLIFDLDGTLIESKWDIAASVNFTLAELGLPQRPIEEIFGFVGDGVKQLLRLSVGESSRVTFDEALRVFRSQYLALTRCWRISQASGRRSPPTSRSSTLTQFFKGWGGIIFSTSSEAIMGLG